MSTSCKLHFLVLAACAIHVPSLQLSSPMPAPPGSAVLTQEDLAHHTSSREKALSQALHKLKQVVHKMGASAQAATQSAAFEEKLKKELEAVEVFHVQAEAKATREVQRQVALGHQSIAMDLWHQVEKMRQRHRKQEHHLQGQSVALHQAVEALARRASNSVQLRPANSLDPEGPKDSSTLGTNYVVDTARDMVSSRPTFEARNAQPSTGEDSPSGQGAQGESRAFDGSIARLQPAEGAAETEISAEPATGNGLYHRTDEPGAVPPPSAVDDFFGPQEAPPNPARVQQDYRPEQREEHWAPPQDDTESQARVKQDYFRNRPEQETVANPGAVIGTLPDASREPVQGEQGQEVLTRHSFHDFLDGSQAKRVPAADKMPSPTEEDLDVAGNINPVVSSIADGSPAAGDAEAVASGPMPAAAARREAFPAANAPGTGTSEEARPPVPGAHTPALGREGPGGAGGPLTAGREAATGTPVQGPSNAEEAAASASTAPVDAAARELPAAARLPTDEIREATPSRPATPAAPESETFPATIARDSEPAAADASGVPLGEASRAATTQGATGGGGAAQRRKSPGFTFEDFDEENSLGAPRATGGAPASPSGVQPQEDPGAGPAAEPFRLPSSGAADAPLQQPYLDSRMPAYGAPASPAVSATEAPLPEGRTGLTPAVAAPADDQAQDSRPDAQPGLPALTTRAPILGQEEAPTPGARNDLGAPTLPAEATSEVADGASAHDSPAISEPAMQERQLEMPAPPSTVGSADSLADVASNNTNDHNEARAPFGPAQVEAVKWAKEEVDRILRDQMEGVRTEASEWAKSEVDRVDKELTARWAKEEADFWKAVDETTQHVVDGVANRWAMDVAGHRPNTSSQEPSDERTEAAAQEILNHTAEVANGAAEVTNTDEARKGWEEVPKEQEQQAEPAAASKDGFMTQTSTNCAAWPTDAAYGCGGKQRNWFKLSNYTSDEECRALCGAKVNEMGRLCCYVGQSFGCWLKPNSQAVKFLNGPGKGVTCAPNPITSPSPATSSWGLPADGPHPPAP